MICLCHDRKDSTDVLVGNPLVKQVAHGVDEDDPRLLPLEWVIKPTRPELQVETLLISIPFDAAPPLGEGLGVAMSTARGDLVAARDRVPRRFCPLNAAG